MTDSSESTPVTSDALRRDGPVHAAGDFRDLVERLPLIVYVDAASELSSSIYVSPQTTEMLGYTPEDWASRPDFFLSIMHPDDLPQVTADISLILTSGRTIDTEYRVLRKDGSIAWVRDEGVLVRDQAGEPLCMQGYMLDITERKRSQALAAGQAELLEFMAVGNGLPHVLDRVARYVEEHSERVLASILIVDRDGDHLRVGAAPSLPGDYSEAIDGVEIGPSMGSCGTAAYRRERVCVSDIEHDPLWDLYREPALAAGLRACWSSPIFATDSTLLGTFALYYRDVREPSADDILIVELAAHLAGIAIERARSEQSVLESEVRYRDLFENANAPIATVALDELITDVNGAFERVLGYSRDELIGTSMAEYLTPAGLEQSLRATERKLSGEASGTTYEQEFRAKDGHAVILEISSRLMEVGGRAIGVQGVCRDVTARNQADVRLRRLSDINRHQALHDDLTGLPNRACFRQWVERTIADADADGSQFGVLVVDLDRFKEINDTLGHRCGDLLLVELARRLEPLVREGETVARLGGDEFGILARRIGPRADGREYVFGERVLAALEQPFIVDGLPLHVEASVGVARFPIDGRDVDLLLQRADVAMYVAKESGLPMATYAPALDRHDCASLKLLSELPRAIREGELVLHYQPQLALRTGDAARVEALVRWQHPLRGLIAPGAFVPAAEKTGLMDPLTLHVLEQALAQVAHWDDEGQRLDLAVNLSMRNLNDPRLPGRIASLLRTWNVTGDRLTVEITESAIISDPARSTAVIRALHELGLRIAIDDFGTGYTSLSYLARLAVSQLKIDRSFVRNMHADRDDAAIVRSIITLGHDLGLEVVAEGVETEATRAQLALLGCDTIQGHWLSRPLPAEELCAWLQGAGTGSRESAA